MLNSFAALAATSRAQFAAFLNANDERKAAEEAEARENWDTALLHYENIYDSTKIDTETCEELQAKFRELRPKVPINTDEAKAGHWKNRVYIFRKLDVTWTDDDGNERRCQNEMTDEDIAGVHTALDGFADYMWTRSSGYLKIDSQVRIIEEPLTQFDTIAGPGECMEYFTDLKMGEADSIFACAKPRTTWEGLGENDIPTRYLGGIVPILPNTQGALFIGFNMFDSAGIMIHEFLHAVGCTLDAYQGYPQGIVGNPDNITDCDLLLKEHATRKMLRELSATRRIDNPWVEQYARDVLVAGPFSYDGQANFGLDEAFIDETSPAPTAEGTWTKVSAVGHVLDMIYPFDTGKHRLAYAVVNVDSDEERDAQMRLGSDGGCRIWHNGREVVYSPVANGAGPDQYTVGVHLAKGPNTFLVKFASNDSWWRLIFRISDPRGNPIDGVTYVAPE